jgi:hypothetical protein
MDLMTSGNRNKAALGARLQGVQHFGLTVRATFYSLEDAATGSA